MRPAGFSCRRTRPVCTGRTCRLPRSPRTRRLHGLPMSPSTSPSDGHAGRTVCAGRMSSQTGSPRQAEPFRAPNSQSFRPKSALNAVRMSFRAVSSSPAQNIAAGLPPMPPPLSRSDRTNSWREASCVFARQMPAGPATRQTDDSANKRIGVTLPAQDSPLPDALLLPRTSVKARERACLAPPLMNDEGRRMTPSPFCAARQARQRRTYCFGR